MRIEYIGIYQTVSNKFGTFVKGEAVELPDDQANVLIRKPKDGTKAEFKEVKPEVKETKKEGVKL